MAIGRNFIASVSTLMSGTVAAQAITFATSFLLARLYSPAQFGHYSVFLGVGGILGAFSLFALDRVIVLARSPTEARRVATTSFAAAICVALAAAIIGAVMGVSPLSGQIPFTTLELALLLPAFSVCYAGAQIFTYINLRVGRVRRIAAFKVLQAATISVVQVTLAPIAMVPGLLVGAVAGWSVPFAAAIKWHISAGRIRQDLRRRSVRSVLRRHWRYPRYVMPNELIDNLSNQLPLLLLGTTLGLSIAGHYGLAIMLLSAPAALVGQGVGQIFLQFLGNSATNHDAIRRSMFRIWVALAAIGIVPFTIVMLFGPEIFALLFGDRWRTAGQIAALLSPLLLIRFISSPTSTVYLKLGLQRAQWFFCLAALVYRTFAYGVGAFGASLQQIIALHVVLEVCAILCFNLYALRQIHASSALVTR